MTQKTLVKEMCGLGLRAVPMFLMLGSTILAQAPKAQTSDPNRTVGPQRDGSIVVSDNQTLTPAGRILELGSPGRAKSIALNPNGKTAGVLLMGSPQPIIVVWSKNRNCLGPNYLRSSTDMSLK